MPLNFDTVYHDFDNRLKKFIHGRVADNEMAEDILQNVYIKIHDTIRQVRDVDRLTSWFYQITRNTIWWNL